MVAGREDTAASVHELSDRSNLTGLKENQIAGERSSHLDVVIRALVTE